MVEGIHHHYPEEEEELQMKKDVKERDSLFTVITPQREGGKENT